MTQHAFIIVGLGFGDEGKGSCVDWLVREHGATLVVRFNGGAQAAHRVVTPEGKEHVFSMFGSGTLAGANTYLSEHVLVNPEVIAVEAAALLDLGVEKPLERLSIHPMAPITTPWHVGLNRLRELSRPDLHGSCGLGIGETMVDVLANEHLVFKDILRSDLRDRLHQIATTKYEEALLLPLFKKQWRGYELFFGKYLERALDDVIDTYRTIARNTQMKVNVADDCVVFEGAQGVLLDEDHGYGAPDYVTWSTTTSQNAHEILSKTDYEITTLGVIRAFMTRHGCGPFPTEVEKPPTAWLDERNEFNPWQGYLRYGNPDVDAIKYAVNVDGRIDGLVVTCLDRVGERASQTIPKVLSRYAHVPLYATSWGPTANDKRLVLDS